MVNNNEIIINGQLLKQEHIYDSILGLILDCNLN